MGEESKYLNIGVIGAGSWATSSHLPGILQHGRAHLIGIQNPDRKTASQIAKDFDAANFFTDYEKLILTQNIDAVVIASTPNAHYAQAKFALQHGKHVLIEKPMTFTVAQAEELLSIAKRKRLQLLVCCPWHYTRHGAKARQLITEGTLGKIKMISILMTNPIDKLLRGVSTSPTHGLSKVYLEPGIKSYSDPKIAGGGQIYTQVSHVGAYLTFLTNSEPTEVYAKFDFDDSQNDIYDTLSINLRDGSLVSIASTGATPENIKNFEIRVFGTLGILLMELWQGKMTYCPFEKNPLHFPNLKKEEIYPYKAPVQNFIDACLGLAPNKSPGEYGVAAMKIIEAACISNSIRKPVKI